MILFLIDDLSLVEFLSILLMIIVKRCFLEVCFALILHSIKSQTYRLICVKL